MERKTELFAQQALASEIGAFNKLPKATEVFNKWGNK